MIVSPLFVIDYPRLIPGYFRVVRLMARRLVIASQRSFAS
jgi:hypothetical protein